MHTRGTKVFTFDMAHMLANHDGLCKNVHGHTYRAEVTIAKHNGGTLFSPGNTSHGMIMDFSNLKNVAKKYFDQFDHAFVYDTTSEAEVEVAAFLAQRNMKVHGLPHRTTAELMAETARFTIEHMLHEEGHPDVVIESVVLYETPTSYATAVR